MTWISLKDKMPEVFEQVLLYKHKPLGGYDTGYYLGHLQQSSKTTYHMIIDEVDSPNKFNYRKVEEFSHWMPLPPEPEQTP